VYRLRNMIEPAFCRFKQFPPRGHALRQDRVELCRLPLARLRNPPIEMKVSELQCTAFVAAAQQQHSCGAERVCYRPTMDDPGEDGKNGPRAPAEIRAPLLQFCSFTESERRTG
jgi:hypothetical protein